MSKRLNFFIVDDDPDIAYLMQAWLEGAGHLVRYERSSEEVTEKIVAANPDCVLVDLMMPVMDGLELCKKLRDQVTLKDTKIIVVSAKSYEFDKKRSYQCGADGFLSKPLKRERFIDYINTILDDLVEIRFWGVHGTLPVPGPTTIRYGGNTSCVSMEFSSGQFFIFDAGTGIKELSDYLVKTNRARFEAKLFISHPHWDHINALPFFIPFYKQGNEFEILGAATADLSMREIVSAQMESVYFPVTLKEFASRVYFRDLREQTIKFDDITVKTMLLTHPGHCLGYRVEYKSHTMCYVTDHELYLQSDPSYNKSYVDKLVSFVYESDVLITDTTYTDEQYLNKIGWGHSSVGQVTDLAHRAKVKALYLFHHDIDQSDDDIDSKLNFATDLLRKRKSITQCFAPAEGDVLAIGKPVGQRTRPIND